MGTGSFIYAKYFSSEGFWASGYLAPSGLILCLTYELFGFYQNYKKIGMFIDRETSNILTKEGKINKQNLIPLLANWYANTAHVFLLAFSFKFAKLGGLNQGVIPIVTSFASLFNAVSFYIGFKETISLPKILGMIFAVSCVIFLSIDSS